MSSHTDEQRFVTVTAHGVEYQIYLTSARNDYIQKNLASRGIPYELPMLTDMKNRLSENSTVLDIGANIGNHTFYLSNVVRCNVIAFEANDELAHAMDITANESGLEDKVTVHAFALGDTPGFAQFDKSIPDNLGAQSLRKGSGKIKIRTLDSFGIMSSVTAIKLDVEGMELDVLKGGKKLIEKNLPILYVESQTKENFSEIASYLMKMGYCYRDTFNATPTHLFIHKTKIVDEGQTESPALARVEHEYDLLEDNRKIKNALVDCQLKYREMCQLNSDIKTENAQLQQQLQANSSTSDSTDMRRLQAELDQIRQKCADAEHLSERLKNEIVSERKEKELQLQKFSQKSVASKLDSVMLEKMTGEVERLIAENRSQKALLDGQQTLEVALQDSKKKAADMSFILDNTKSEVIQLQSDKAKLAAALKEKEKDGAELLKLREEIAQMHEQGQTLKLDLKKQLAQLELQLQKNTEQAQVLQAQAADIENLQEKIDVLEQERTEHNNSVESIQAAHEQYIQGLRTIYEQQQRDNEQQMQLLIQKKIESLVPLQANQEKLDKLIDYRNDIEKIYSERTPLLTDFPDDQGIEQIQEKKSAIELLNQELAEFNKQHSFPS